MMTLCRHILTSGSTCEQPALRENHYCRFHVSTAKVARRRSRSITLDLVFPDDRAAVQLNLHLIALAALEGHIEPQVARALTHTYRACMANLNAGPLLTADPKTTVSRVILTPEGEEIATPRQVLEPDETLHHGPECPCAVCAEQYRHAPPEQHHPDCPCGLCHPSESYPHNPDGGEQKSTDVILSVATERSGVEEPAFQHPDGAPFKPDVGLGGEQKNTDVILSEARSAESKNLRLQTEAAPSSTPAQRTASVGEITGFPPITTPAEPRRKHKPAPVSYKAIIREHFTKLDANEAARDGKPAPGEQTPLELLEESNRRYEEETAQIERNKQAAEESWRRYAASEAGEGRAVTDPLNDPLTLPDKTPTKLHLTWNEQEDLRLAARKQLPDKETESPREAGRVPHISKRCGQDSPEIAFPLSPFPFPLYP